MPAPKLLRKYENFLEKDFYDIGYTTSFHILFSSQKVILPLIYVNITNIGQFHGFILGHHNCKIKIDSMPIIGFNYSPPMQCLQKHIEEKAAFRVVLIKSPNS